MSFDLLKELSTKEQLENIKLGGVFLGSGGGGPIHVANDIISAIVDENGNMEKTVKVIQPDSDDITKNKKATAVCFMGSPAQAGKINVEAPLESFKKMGEDFIYPLSIESGGVNSLAPIITAVKSSDNDLALVDGDGVGRAVPTIQNTLYANTSGVDLSKTIIHNAASDDNSAQVSTEIKIDNASVSAEDVESCCINIVNSSLYDTQGGMSVFCVNSESMKEALVESIFSEMHYIGEQVSEDVDVTINGINSALKELGYTFYLFEGKIDKINEPAKASLDNGSVIIKADDGSNDTLTLFYLNENLLAVKNLPNVEEEVDIAGATPDNIWAMAPDLISYLILSGSDSDLSYPTPGSNVEVKEGDKVLIYGISVKDKIRNNKAVVSSFLEVLNKMGFKGDSYIKIEDLHKE